MDAPRAGPAHPGVAPVVAARLGRDPQPVGARMKHWLAHLLHGLRAGLAAYRHARALHARRQALTDPF